MHRCIGLLAGITSTKPVLRQTAAADVPTESAEVFNSVTRLEPPHVTVTDRGPRARSCTFETFGGPMRSFAAKGR